jgi:hypothetical protein
MTARYFVDTNVLLYAGSNAREDRQKREMARRLLLDIVTRKVQRFPRKVYVIGQRAKWENCSALQNFRIYAPPG